MMKAWLYSSATGGLEKNLQLNLNAPQPRQPLFKNEILVEVISMSINPADAKLPELGLVAKALISTPASPGLDYCGRVVATGTVVDSVRIGEIIFGKLEKPTKFGTLGQYVVVTHEDCASLPDGVDPDHAAAIGTAGLTAYQSIIPYVKAGSKVFINGGSGGVGTFGIQIAKNAGCHVTTTCSAPNVSLCQELGADDVIDYKTTDVYEELVARGQIFDLVVDNAGTPLNLYKDSANFLKPEGIFEQVGGPMSFSGTATVVSNMLLPSFLGGGKRPYHFFVAKNSHDDLAEIGRLMKEGKIRAIIDSTFEYEDAPKAFEKLKTGRARGKIVVHVTKKP